MTKTPDFWYRRSLKGVVLQTLLTPFSYLFDTGQKLHRALSNPQPVAVPVICIGNITAGGGGKTPTVQAIVRLIKDNHLSARPFILSRGYGSQNATPVIVDPAAHTAADVGDEPLLHGRIAPTIVCTDRHKAALAAIDQGATCLITDDGFYNYDIAYDMTFVVVDGQAGFGNGKIIPAGPLREKSEKGLERADGIICVGGNSHHIAHQNIFSASVRTHGFKAEKGGNYIAFCGLAIPNKFFRFLRAMPDITIIDTIAFPDHHVYSDSDIKYLQSLNHPLLTTEKDFVKLPEYFKNHVTPVPIRMIFDDESSMINLLKSVLT